jgi:PAS domain S-box-containing protein
MMRFGLGDLGNRTESPTRARDAGLGSQKLIFVLLGVFLLFLSPAPGQVEEVRRVLIFNELGLWSPGIAAIDQEIFAALEKTPYRIEFYSEDLDTSLFSDEASQRQFRDWYFHKYRDRKPDLIIAVGPSPIKFMADSHAVFAPNTPIVFWGGTAAFAEPPKLDSDFTGVWGVAEPDKTLDVALQLQPNTKHVVVVGGVAPYDRYLEGLVKQRFQKYESKLDFTYLTDLAMPDLLERLKHLASNTIVYHTSIMQDAAGKHFIDAIQSAPMVASAANAPVFAVDDVDVGKGTVGGYVFSFALTGQVAGGMAVRILNGEKPRDIPIVRGANKYMFDWRALRRWGLRESDLPAGSIVLNRQPTVWEAYKWYIVGGIALILAQTLLIVGLAWQRARRRKAETELEITNDRLRQAVEAGKCVGWDWDAKTGRDRWFGDLQTMFGIQSDTYSGPVEDFYSRVHPEDRAIARTAVADARRSLKPFTAEFRVLRLDGTVRWINARGQFYYAANGDAERMLGMAVDITERKQAEQVLREGEERFRLVANTAPVKIWMSGADKLCSYFNQRWLEFTGRPLDAEVGNGWTEGVHPEDLSRCMQTYTQAFDRRESFQMEYRLRRHDGQYRWLSVIGVPRFNPDHCFAGYIGSATDLTDRKLAEEALANIGRKLIEAHEEERTWIARELHDDINQRIALLAIKLDRWNHLPGSDADTQNHIQTISQGLSDIGKDVQALSHRLHSSKLEYLGVVAAARSFCKELSEQHQVEIDFSHSDIPHGLPKEVALCLFRVLQEALQNAVKHSGARHLKAELRGAPEEIQLIVNDQGVGFEEQDAINRRGIGLISMRERLQLVHGEISINSQPGIGTTIHARVPFPQATIPAGRAG